MGAARARWFVPVLFVEQVAAMKREHELGHAVPSLRRGRSFSQEETLRTRERHVAELNEQAHEGVTEMDGWVNE